MTDDEVTDLQAATKSFRVTFSSNYKNVVREGGSGDTYFSAAFYVGTDVSVVVECLDEKGQVIMRTISKTVKITSGENNVSFKLSEDGTKIEPDPPQPTTVSITFKAGYYFGLTHTWAEMRDVIPPQAGDRTIGDSINETMALNGFTFRGWVIEGDYNPNATSYSAQQMIAAYPSTEATLVGIWEENVPILYVSANGSDSNSGTSADNAFAHLKKACDVVNAGSDTAYIIIVSGTITEMEACILNTNKTVTIKTDTQPATVLRGSGETSTEGTGTDFRIEITNGTVNFEGTATAPLTIDGNKNVFTGHQYLLLHIDGGNNTVKVKIGSNVTFQNNSRTRAWAMGSAMGITGAGVTLTLDGGAIKDNDAWRLAAGVDLRNGATFIMNSGTISGNTVTDVGDGHGGEGSGGGVYVGGNSGTDKAPTFTMNGGSITGNTARGRGGGIFVEAGGICTVSSSASVTGNTADGDGSGLSGNQIYAEANATYNGTTITKVE